MKIQTLGLEETEIEERKQKIGFWKRQFQTEATGSQKVFDGIFGAFLPAACFFLDPIVFRGNGALLTAFKPFAYLFSYFSVMALLAFVLFGEKLKWFNGFLSGLFTLGAIISFAIGIILFPFSLLGLVVLIGILGFTPLFTGFVFWRNAVRSYKIAELHLETKVLVNMMLLSAVFSFTIPEIINVKIYKGLETIKTADAQTIRGTTKRLKYFAPILNAESYGKKYYTVEPNPEREAAINEAFRELNGRNINEREWELFKLID